MAFPATQVPRVGRPSQNAAEFTRREQRIPCEQMARAVPIAPFVPKLWLYSTNKSFDTFGTIGTHSRAAKTRKRVAARSYTNKGRQAAPPLWAASGSL
jgi:hypothetical protein